MVIKEWEYGVKDDVIYSIKIIVGNHQKGHSSFEDLTGKYIDGGETLEHELGKGLKLKGKYIEISTHTDRIGDKSRVTVSYLINEKLIDVDENPIKRKVGENFIAKINFIS